MPKKPTYQQEVKEEETEKEEDSLEEEDFDEEESVDVDYQQQAEDEETYLEKLEAYFKELEQKYGQAYADRQKRRFILARKLRLLIEQHEGLGSFNAKIMSQLEDQQRKSDELHKSFMESFKKLDERSTETHKASMDLLKKVEQQNAESHEKCLEFVKKSSENQEKILKMLEDSDTRDKKLDEYIREILALKEKKWRKDLEKN